MVTTTLLEVMPGGGAIPRTVAAPLVRRTLGTPARTHFFILPFIRVVSEGVTELIGHTLGSFPPLPLFCPPHPVLKKDTQHNAEDPYAAGVQLLVLRLQLT